MERKKAPPHIRRAIERARKQKALELYIASPSAHMDLPIVDTGRTVRFRLSKADRAKRRAQDAAARSRPNRLRAR